MKSINFNKAEFVLSAASVKQFIHSSVPAVIFAGKSNVGKSSAINQILNRKNFARSGNTPGKTVHINYFLIDGKVYFIDLPGYGFADVAKSERDRWGKLMEEFFAEKDLFSSCVLIVDSRHKPTEDDCRMFDVLKSSGKPFAVLANKVDKLKKSEIQNNLDVIRSVLAMEQTDILIPFSAEKGTGRNELIRFITDM
ncbi:MAG: ribosome biogenesis GTP-binding protein YihA/YsxC [Eubacteriales bacterium]|nr:ribosome biogenesis GTP-binding protein YihA/YsxC [Eubacteriales bacterium]